MTISVLGCGWLGFPFAQHLLNKDFEVRGSTTSKDKLPKISQAGIKPYLIELPKSLTDPNSDSFWSTEILFLNIPPGRGNKNVLSKYPKMIEGVVNRVKQHSDTWIIFASSTSVYSETGEITSEDDAKPGTASRLSGEVILTSEAILKESGLPYTILRFGGLYGYGRHPVNHLSGKHSLKSPCKPVNLVHQSDCIRVLDQIIHQKKVNKIYNVVSDGHPPRKEFYLSAAKHFNLPLPKFGPSEDIQYRVISNQKLKDELNFSFSYPNPMDHTP
jgi:nucleoside-diphosphate-sugar epimerase